MIQDFELLPASSPKLHRQKKISNRPTPNTLAKRVAPYLRQLFPVDSGLGQAEIFHKHIAHKDKSLVHQIKATTAFETYLVMLQEQITNSPNKASPIGCSKATYTNIINQAGNNDDDTEDNNTNTENDDEDNITDAERNKRREDKSNRTRETSTDDTSNNTNDDLAAVLAQKKQLLRAKQLAEIAKIDALLDTPTDKDEGANLNDRLGGTAQTPIEIPDKSAKANQTKKDGNTEHQALSDRIAELEAEKQAGFSSEQIKLATAIFGKNPDKTHTQLSTFSAKNSTLGRPASAKVGTICPPKLYDMIRKLGDINLDVAFAHVTRASCIDQYVYEEDASGIPVPTLRTSAVHKIDSENALGRTLNAIIAGVKKINTDLGTHLSNTWNMSFLQMQAIYPSNIPLQKEYLQRQLDSLFDALREGQGINVDLDINLGIQLQAIFPTLAPQITNNTDHGNGANHGRGTKGKANANGTKTTRPFKKTITDDIKNTPCINWSHGTACAFDKCPYKHDKAAWKTK
ncbi:MAG: hypothetical protein COB29_01180 [Sulfitobacter sp.]|nr:MAG: hypothetical protein COB29_01180 [Sulfitobacter sp.]